MNIQLALDRMSIDEAIYMAQKVRCHVDWIEVGTSLIKEFGVDSIKRLRAAFPDKTIVADIKTNDNAKYEFELCFNAGADVATVMGTAPEATIRTCMETAKRYNKQVMIDLLNIADEKIESLVKYDQAYLCAHISKDQQEIDGESASLFKLPKSIAQSRKLAVAGGINVVTLENLVKADPYVVIVGSAITKADHPEAAAKAMKDYILEHSQIKGA